MYFDEKEAWYKDEILRTLLVIADSKAVLEVNTGGIARGYVKHPHPSPWVFKDCQKLGIPIMLNSDAHSPIYINSYFKEVIPMLLEAGFKDQRIILNGAWVNVSLE